jgi:hypothetical protein
VVVASADVVVDCLTVVLVGGDVICGLSIFIQFKKERSLV